MAVSRVQYRHLHLGEEEREWEHVLGPILHEDSHLAPTILRNLASAGVS